MKGSYIEDYTQVFSKDFKTIEAGTIVAMDKNERHLVDKQQSFDQHLDYIRLAFKLDINIMDAMIDKLLDIRIMGRTELKKATDEVYGWFNSQ